MEDYTWTSSTGEIIKPGELGAYIEREYQEHKREALEDWLPIRTVVSLLGDPQGRLMIIGCNSVSPSGIRFNHIGCKYPASICKGSGSKLFDNMFNPKQIQGYRDTGHLSDAQRAYQKKLIREYGSLRETGISAKRAPGSKNSPACRLDT